MSEYTGKLLKKIKPLLLLDSVDSPDAQKRKSEYISAFKAREVALFKHFGISGRDQKAWRELALGLAAKHVPAFARKRGRPPKYADENNIWLMLYCYVKVRDCSKNRDAYRVAAAILQKDAELVERRLKDFAKSHGLRQNTLMKMYGAWANEGALKLSNEELSTIYT